jgi:hypothetical protein
MEYFSIHHIVVHRVHKVGMPVWHNGAVVEPTMTLWHVAFFFVHDAKHFQSFRRWVTQWGSRTAMHNMKFWLLHNQIEIETSERTETCERHLNTTTACLRLKDFIVAVAIIIVILRISKIYSPYITWNCWWSKLACCQTGTQVKDSHIYG